MGLRWSFFWRGCGEFGDCEYTAVACIGVSQFILRFVYFFFLSIFGCDVSALDCLGFFWDRTALDLGD